MAQHDEYTRRILRRSGLSEQSELSPEERKNLAAARAAYSKNPNISREALFRTLRPKPDTPPYDDV